MRHKRALMERRTRWQCNMMYRPEARHRIPRWRWRWRWRIRVPHVAMLIIRAALYTDNKPPVDRHHQPGPPYSPQPSSQQHCRCVISYNSSLVRTSHLHDISSSNKQRRRLSDPVTLPNYPSTLNQHLSLLCVGSHFFSKGSLRVYTERRRDSRWRLSFCTQSERPGDDAVRR
jgi:hypothetical protein